MNAKRIIAVAAIASLLLLLTIWMWPTSSDPAPAKPATKTTAPKSKILHNSPKAPPSKSAEAEPAHSAGDEPYALYAEALGGAWIKCESPVPVPADVSRVLFRGEWNGTTLRAQVSAESGVEELYGRSQLFPCANVPKDEQADCNRTRDIAPLPFGILRWSNAKDGGQGDCEITPVKMVEVRGRVDGSKTCNLNGCRRNVLLEDGTFTIDCPADTPQSLSCYEADFVATADVETGTGLSGVVLVAPPPKEVITGIPALEDAIEKLTAELGRSSIIEAVLEYPELSPEARSVLLAWQQDDQDALEYSLRNLNRQYDQALSLEERRAENKRRQPELLADIEALTGSEHPELDDLPAPLLQLFLDQLEEAQASLE